MKVCVLTRSIPKNNIGGMENYTWEIVQSMSQNPLYKFYIITTRHPERIKFEKDGEISIYYENAIPGRFTFKHFLMTYLKYKEIDKKSRFDLVHSQDFSAFFYALEKILRRKNRFRLITTIHGTPLEQIKSMRNSGSLTQMLSSIIQFPIAYFLLWVTLVSSDFIIVVSAPLKQQVKREYHISSKKIKLITNGIDTDKFTPLKVARIKKLEGIKFDLNDKIILSVGRLTCEKGVQYLLKSLELVLREIRNFKLLIIGEGIYQPELQKIVEDLKLQRHVYFLGPIKNDQLPKYYNLADIFVMPTVRIEGLPLTLLESMSCGNSVIASNIGGIPTVVNSGKNGLLIPPRDIYSLSRNIIKLCKDDSLIKNLGKNARESILKNFDSKKMIIDTLEAYRELLNKG